MPSFTGAPALGESCRDRIVAVTRGIGQAAAEAVPCSLPAGLLRVRIVRRQAGVDVEIGEIDVLQRRPRTERHHDVDDEPYARRVTGGDERDQIGIRRRRRVA